MATEKREERRLRHRNRRGSRFGNDSRHYGDTRYGYWDNNKFYYYENHRYSTGHRNGYHTYNYNYEEDYHRNNNNYKHNRRGSSRNYRNRKDKDKVDDAATNKNKDDQNNEIDQLIDEADRNTMNDINNHSRINKLLDRDDDDAPATKRRKKNASNRDDPKVTMRYDKI